MTTQTEDNAWTRFHDRMVSGIHHIYMRGGTTQGFVVVLHPHDWYDVLAACPMDWARSLAARTGIDGEAFGMPVRPMIQVPPGKIILRCEVEV